MPLWSAESTPPTKVARSCPPTAPTMRCSEWCARGLAKRVHTERALVGVVGMCEGRFHQGHTETAVAMRSRAPQIVL